MTTQAQLAVPGTAVFPNDPVQPLGHTFNVTQLQFTGAELAGVDYVQITINGVVKATVKISA